MVGSSDVQVVLEHRSCSEPSVRTAYHNLNWPSKGKMNDDADHSRMSVINGSHQPSTGRASWQQAPTKISMPSSRTTGSGNPSSRSPLKSHLNLLGAPPPNNLKGGNTVAPMKRMSTNLLPQQPAKKPRPSESMKRPRTSDGSTTTATDVELSSLQGRPNIMPSAGKTLRGTLENVLEDKLSGRSMSPVEDSESDDTLLLKESPDKASTSRMNDIPTGPAFTLFAPHRPSLENGRNPSKDLPHLDMRAMSKPSRVSQMKDRAGKTSSQIQAQKKPAPKSTKPLTFDGAHDPLSQSSMRHRSKPESEPIMMESISSDDTSAPKLKILEAFFGRVESPAVPVGYLRLLDDKVDGMRFELDIRENKYPIKKEDMAWLCHDGNTLFISIRPDSGLFRNLRNEGVLPPGSLESGFPGRTLSLKFRDDELENGTVSFFLESISPPEKPPSNLKKPSSMWYMLETQAVKLKSQLIKPLAEDRPRRVSLPALQPEVQQGSSDLSSPPASPVLPKGKGRATRRSLATSRKDDIEPIALEVTNMRQTRKRDSISGNIPSRENDDEVILVYPPTGPGGVQITYGEHCRLCPGEFLNDTLIEFGLRFWLESLKETNPALADEIHVFSPFFYKKLKNKDIDAGYNAVRKWTSKVDIFKKRYLVVPINERLHWYLAIIMYPEHILRLSPPPSTSEPGTNPPQMGASDRTPSPDVIIGSPRISEPSLPQSRASTPPGPLQETEDVEMTSASPSKIDDQREQVVESDDWKKEAVELDSPNAPSSPGVRAEDLIPTDNESNVSIPNEKWRASQDSTWILTFDSLGSKHPSVCLALKRYLAREAKHKKGIDVGDEGKTEDARVPSPVQPNYCDCGVYLIQTAETFLGRADGFFRQFMNDNDPLSPIHSLWDTAAYGVKRQKLFETIQQLSNDWKTSKGLKITPAPVFPSEPTTTQSQASVVEMVQEKEPEAAPAAAQPIPHQEISSDDENEIEFTGEIRFKKGRLMPGNAAKLTARRRK